MAQRVGIARALLRAPRLLLMDEPFASLYAITRSELQRALRALVAAQQATCLFVTHDVDEAIAMDERLFVMHAGGIARQFDAPWCETETRAQVLRELDRGGQPSSITPTHETEEIP